MQYHHTGVVTDQKQPNEFYVEATKVWVTDPDDHPYRIEFLRFEPEGLALRGGPRAADAETGA